jgi:hypothetical protein
MKVKCINSEYSNNCITLGKIYSVINISEYGNFKIINDYGEEYLFANYRFRPLSKSEYRNEAIDKLLGE